MAACIIFCAADFTSLVRPIAPDDHVIAADGGLRHLQALDITPAQILGDFDSLGYTPHGANVFPVEKDDTDAMLAVRRGLALGFREFLIYGGLGGQRLDHTLANLQTLHFLAEHGARGILCGPRENAALVKNGTLTFPPEARGTVSVFCAGADARGVTLRGLYYPLEEGTLTAAFPLGISNHFTGSAASVTVREGALLVLWQDTAVLPAWEEPPHADL